MRASRSTPYRSAARRLRHWLAGRPSRRSAAALNINVVDDPDATMRLIGVRGLIDSVNVAHLVRVLAEPTAAAGLHLDVHDALIAAPEVLDRIEACVDEVERQGVAVRIVGLDPTHPAIAHR